MLVAGLTALLGPLLVLSTPQPGAQYPRRFTARSSNERAATASLSRKYLAAELVRIASHPADAAAESAARLDAEHKARLERLQSVFQMNASEMPQSRRMRLFQDQVLK